MTVAEERIELMAHALNAVSHSVAGPLQSAMNRLFILQKKAAHSSLGAGALDELETEFRTIAGRLAELSALPHVFRSSSLRKVGLREIVHSAVAISGLTSRVVVAMPWPDTTVFVDGGNLVRALAAVLTNAAEASPEGSSIALSAGLDGRFVALRVTDQGTTHWPSPPEQAFDPLYTTKPQSLGLGLPLAVRVATAAGGGVFVEPREVGSTVSILIPQEVADGA